MNSKNEFIPLILIIIFQMFYLFLSKHQLMSKQQYIDKINKLTTERVPFIFIIDYLHDEVIIQELSDVNSNEILYSVGSINNSLSDNVVEMPKSIYFEKTPVTLHEYEESFKIVKQNLKQGNSYLTNLTFETSINTNLTLKQIFHKSMAPYKLWYKDRFVVFSPEIFVKIKDGKIMSFPMKGTIDADLYDAENVILNDRKESAEHATIVDLIRNDLSMVATKVKVDKYRYIDKIKTDEGSLLQVSSQISGQLPNNYQKNLGEILFSLLPAGSISGAPKRKTIEIINDAENYDRGFYTGIFGIFDGENLDSSVMIRFIEQEDNRIVFKSGGGITVNSDLENEYNEMIQKVYLSFDD